MSASWDGAAGVRPTTRGPTMRPPSRARTRVALVVVAAAVGFLVAVQAGHVGERSSRLAAETPENLTAILADLNAEADRLARSVASLRVKLQKYRTSATDVDLQVRDAQRALADLRVLSGIVPVRGPGVSLRIVDPKGTVGWEAMLDVVQELRDAGAEAIALNDRRIVGSSWLGPADGGIAVDGEPVAAPYRFDAIGSSGVIREALAIPGGPLSFIQTQAGAQVETTIEEELVLPALQRQIAFRYARPAP
ncbi:MAG: DUF881 domain-containing protein [Actinomycetota bacterium]|nr:DUF881 domain-containing protein [Actinomycetota bacterium]